MRDLRAHDVDMLTIGQYLQPTADHLPVLRYVHPDIFKMFEREALAMGFSNAACGPHGALVVPRRSAGARRRRGLNASITFSQAHRQPHGLDLCGRRRPSMRPAARTIR